MTRRAVALAALVPVGAVPAAAVSHGDGHHRTVVDGHQVRFDGLGPERWAARWRREHRMVVTLRHRIVRQRYIVMHREDVAEAIGLAGATYGNGSTLWRLARCESGLNPNAKNRHSDAAGLLQFMPSTLNSTPYKRFDIYSPYVSALAAGWMLAHGRRNEWVC